jgi:hypothetical protein
MELLDCARRFSLEKNYGHHNTIQPHVIHKINDGNKYLPMLHQIFLWNMNQQWIRIAFGLEDLHKNGSRCQPANTDSTFPARETAIMFNE